MHGVGGGLRVSGVGVRYGRTEALHDVTWDIPTGVTALLGPNGSGKTTLLRSLAGLERLSTGAIDLAVGERGRRSGLFRRARMLSKAVGYVPQSGILPPHVPIVESVAYCGWLTGLTTVEARTAAGQALRRVRLNDLASSRYRVLSGGQQRRAIIAAGIVHSPRIMLLDEPTVGIDPAERLHLRDVLAELGSDPAATVLISTHLMEDVEHLCENVDVLKGGRLVFTGSIDALTEQWAGEDSGGRGSRAERAYADVLADLG